jgi:hypothetical protein
MVKADDITSVLAEMKDGWFGALSKAPLASVRQDIASALVGISFVFDPDIEVDPDDGSVILRWVNGSESFSLTFLGQGNVGGCYLPSAHPAAWKVPVGDAAITIKENIDNITRPAG